MAGVGGALHRGDSAGVASSKKIGSQTWVHVSRLQSLRSPAGLLAFEFSGIPPTLLLIMGFNLLEPACVWEHNFTGLRPPIVAHNFKGVVRLHSGNSKKELPYACGFQACLAH